MGACRLRSQKGLKMGKAKIYKFKKYDINSDRYVVSRRMATREAIERIEGAVTIPETEIEIDNSHLNGDGMTDIDFTA